MGKRGPRPKPTALKLLHGNPGKRALNKSEPKPEVRAPDCPEWLDPLAKKEWARVTPKLERLGLITELDMAVLAGYCQSYARWRQAEAIITKEGMYYEQETQAGTIKARHPVAAIMQQERRLVRQFASEFGFSPSMRSGMQMLPDDGEDELSKFMRGNRNG